MKIVDQNSTVRTIQVNNEFGFGDFDSAQRTGEVVDMRSSSCLVPTNAAQAESILSDTNDTSSSRRKRRAISSGATSPSIPHPLLCLSLGEVVVFKVTINLVNRSLSNFPRYRKDHLFNTNPNFDYGNFRQLQTFILQTNRTISTFVHAFAEPGIFVFYDNAAPAKEVVVMVPKVGASCPNNLRIDAATQNNLGLFGIKKNAVSTTQIFRF